MEDTLDSRRTGASLTQMVLMQGGRIPGGLLPLREIQASLQFAQISQFQTSLRQYGIEEDPSITAVQMSTLSIVEEALPPSSPSSPRTRFDMLVTSLLGLSLAGLATILLEYPDNRIKSPDDLKTLTGMPNLGSVPFGQI